MDSVQLAYMAGLFDGEGCVGIYTPRQLILNIEMTNRRGLEIFSLCFNCPISVRSPRKFNARQSYVVQLSADNAYNAIKTLHPYLCIKRQKAELVMSTWEKFKMFPYEIKKYLSDYQEKVTQLDSTSNTGTKTNGNRRGIDLKPRKKRGNQLVQMAIL